jgi:hypothetical protein
MRHLSHSLRHLSHSTRHLSHSMRHLSHRMRLFSGIGVELQVGRMKNKRQSTPKLPVWVTAHEVRHLARRPTEVTPMRIDN